MQSDACVSANGQSDFSQGNALVEIAATRALPRSVAGHPLLHLPFAAGYQPWLVDVPHIPDD